MRFWIAAPLLFMILASNGLCQINLPDSSPTCTVGDFECGNACCPEDLYAAYCTDVIIVATGRWTDAVLLREKVLQASRWLHGDEHLSTLRAIASLAATYRNQERWAVKLEEDVLVARTRLL